MNDVTQILSRIDSGDPSAADELLPLVYNELRKLAAARLAHEQPGQTLQATALVHEAYVRLVDGDQGRYWKSRGHFFGAAAEAMRRLLVEQARRKKRMRHGALLAIDDALEQLAVDEPEAAQVVKLRYFAGLTIEDTAAAMEISVRTVNRHWTYARAWLYQQLG
jgi:DNA-directed RNA polymerase specialized sigma24 family protein